MIIHVDYSISMTWIDVPLMPLGRSAQTMSHFWADHVRVGSAFAEKDSDGSSSPELSRIWRAVRSLFLGLVLLIS